jgi:hypothetical protein
MRNSVIASQSSQYVVITTIIVYALIAPIFFEMENAYGEGVKFVTDTDKKTMTYSLQTEVDSDCESPCPSSAEMCIAMCA